MHPFDSTSPLVAALLGWTQTVIGTIWLSFAHALGQGHKAHSARLCPPCKLDSKRQ